MITIKWPSPQWALTKVSKFEEILHTSYIPLPHIRFGSYPGQWIEAMNLIMGNFSMFYIVLQVMCMFYIVLQLMDKSKLLSVRLNLSTLYHKIPTFNDPKKAAFWKHCRKRRKCWSPVFSPFPTMFSTHPKLISIFLLIFILLSANALNLDQSKILSFGKELTLYHTIQTFNNSENKGFWKHCGKRRKCW